MSGSAGGNRIPRTAVENTVQNYIKNVLSKFPQYKSARVTGSYNAGTKQDFGDIDLIVQIEGTDKKLIKQELSKYFASLPDSVIVPFKSDKYKGKKSLSSGELVTVLYPIVGMPNEFVQIDNMVSISKEESTFKNTFLDYPAEVQGLLLGLAKVICLEENPQEIFKRLGIKNIPTLGPNQEYEFNLSSQGLTLRIVTLDNFKEIDRTEVWKAGDWNAVKKLFQNFNIDSDFKTLLKTLSSKLKNERSKNRVKGIFKSMVSVKSGEVNTPKGDNKQASLNDVDTLLENMLFKGLTKSLISNVLFENESQETIALYPGKFKPPHVGHFKVAKQLLNKANKIEILISSKPVEGINAEQSKAVWELYNTLLGGKLDIKIIQGSPIKYVLDTIEANPNTHYIAVYGKGDQDRYRNIGKDPRYMNAETFDGGSISSDDKNINATDLRTALANNEDISKFLPKGITPEQYEKALGMDEIISENCSIQQPEIPCHCKPYFASLTKFLASKMNIEPLPALNIINNDIGNAENILGKTAYYDPLTCSITLYTLGRHPKDILRSYAHEMVHRMQDNEGRLTNINTTDINEDEYLKELEGEAYLKGNLLFREWETLIKNPIKEWIIDMPKHSFPKNTIYMLYETLNEIVLSKENAVKINGDTYHGDFQVGDVKYIFNISKFPNPYEDEGDFFSIAFHPEGEEIDKPKEGKENYISILSTIYKIILDFAETIKPKYIGISSLDNDKNYHMVYANLTDNKHNRIPGYFRKDVNLTFKTTKGDKGHFIVLKRKDV